MQGARILKNEAYLLYVAVTKDEAQHCRWTFCEVVNCERNAPGSLSSCYPAPLKMKATASQ